MIQPSPQTGNTIEQVALQTFPHRITMNIFQPWAISRAMSAYALHPPCNLVRDTCSQGSLAALTSWIGSWPHTPCWTESLGANGPSIPLWLVSTIISACVSGREGTGIPVGASCVYSQALGSSLTQFPCHKMVIKLPCLLKGSESDKACGEAQMEETPGTM